MSCKSKKDMRYFEPDLSPFEKLGLTSEEMQYLLDKFTKYYSNPLYHKGVLWGEFEAFVVGYKLRFEEEKQIEL